MNKTIPNFFIVGAPKCGTTAMAEYLSKHPSIYMSPAKEPHFFTTDWPGLIVVKTLKQYLSLFDGVKPDHKVIAEASTGYIYTDLALKNIFEFNPNAKILVMLRNPVELVHAYHMQLLYQADEDQEDFEVAWGLQEQRSKGYNIPKLNREPKKLQYKKIGSLGSQVERMLKIFPEDQVKIVLFDDFVKSTKDVYEDILKFLDVESDGRDEFPKVNESKAVTSKWRIQVAAMFRKVYGRYFWLFQLKRRLGLQKLRVWDQLTQVQKQSRTPIKDEFRKELIREFEQDIAKLESIINRDLKHWRS